MSLAPSSHFWGYGPSLYQFDPKEQYYYQQEKYQDQQPHGLSNFLPTNIWNGFQDRQAAGFVGVIPLGILAVLLATLGLAVATTFINQENDRIFRAQANNIAPAGAPASGAIVLSPPIVTPMPSALITVMLRSIDSTNVGNVPVTITPSSFTRSGRLTQNTNAQGVVIFRVTPGVVVDITIADGNIITPITTVRAGSTTGPIINVVSQPLKDGEVKAVLTWSQNVMDLDLGAMEKECTCLVFYGEPECPGSAKIDKDTALPTALETITFNGFTTDLLLYVHNYDEQEGFVDTGAQVTIFAGLKAESINIPATDPNPNSLFWIVGTINPSTGTFTPEPPETKTLSNTDLGICPNLFNDFLGRRRI